MTNKFETTISSEYSGMRLDKALALLFPQFSRSSLQKWLKMECVHIDGAIVSQKYIVRSGERIELIQPPEIEIQACPEPIELDIVYQDDDLFVINKPCNLVVHPGAGNPNGTLLNGLLNIDAKLAALPRCGIVHRLDKDTTGLMVVARNEVARLILIDTLAKRQIKRQYNALVQGVPIAGQTIDAAISRSIYDRKKMMVNNRGKKAVTHFKIIRKFDNFSLLLVSLETGRTHQIRVHMQHIGFPIVGDPIYNNNKSRLKNSNLRIKEIMKNFNRQALHACKLAFTHPINEKSMNFTCSMPSDMQQLVDSLAVDNNDD